MSSQQIAIIDPVSGISGDMLLGALLGAGASMDWLRALPGRLGLKDVEVTVRPVVRCGIAALKVDVTVRGEIEGPTDIAAVPVPHEHGAGHSHRHQHGHDHVSAHLDEHGHEHHAHAGHAAHEQHLHDHQHGHAHHRHLRDLLKIVERAPLSDWVKVRALEALRLLGAAEGRVHGVAPDDVALHEVGAMDALVDIVGGIEGFEQLGISQIYSRAVAVGSGWVRCAHGTMPVPAPATAILLEGLVIAANGPVTGEATTPTGAALLRVLSQGPPPERWRARSAAAWGAGSRDPGNYPNALRLVVGDAVLESAEVVSLACDLDDLSPEYLEPLREALTEAGAIDVQVWATQMKKGRTGFRVEAVASTGDSDAVSDAMLRHSTTGGLRRTTAERVTLDRREITVALSTGDAVRVKVIDAPGGLRAKPEFDDVALAARRTGQPAHLIARSAHVKALELLDQTPDTDD